MTIPKRWANMEVGPGDLRLTLPIVGCVLAQRTRTHYGWQISDSSGPLSSDSLSQVIVNLAISGLIATVEVAK